MERTLEGKVALVTGAGKGIGRAVALRLAAEGARVAVCGRTQAPIDATVKKLRDAGAFAKAYRLDVRDRSDVDKTVGRAAAELVEGKRARLDLVVSCAGILAPTPIASADEARWLDIMDTNVNGIMRVTRAALKAMPDGGRVVNVASILAKTGAAGFGAYTASKHAVVGLTRALAAELAPRRITVNAVCPGWTDTDMATQALAELAGGRGDPLRLRRRVEERIPLGRFVDPVEVADLIVFLAGPGGGMITGQALSICGGEALY